MVCDGVSLHHRTQLFVIVGILNAVRYREDILLHHVGMYPSCRLILT